MAKEKNRLFFLAGSQPTAEETAAAAALNMVRFRNAALVGDADSLEFADEVAGKVPAGYAKMEGCKVVQAAQPVQQTRK